jgi:hypothetical protein
MRFFADFILFLVSMQAAPQQWTPTHMLIAHNCVALTASLPHTSMHTHLLVPVEQHNVALEVQRPFAAAQRINMRRHLMRLGYAA